MSKALSLATSMQLAAQRLALDWAKKNLPEEKYNEIRASYRAIMKRTTIFVLCVVLPIIINSAVKPLALAIGI